MTYDYDMYDYRNMTMSHVICLPDQTMRPVICHLSLSQPLPSVYYNYFLLLLTDSRSNKDSSKIEDTRHIHTTYILLQIKYNNIYCTKKGSSFLHTTIIVIYVLCFELCVENITSPGPYPTR